MNPIKKKKTHSFNTAKKKASLHPSNTSDCGGLKCLPAWLPTIISQTALPILVAALLAVSNHAINHGKHFSPHMEAKHLSELNILATPSPLLPLMRQPCKHRCFSAHKGSKTLPSAGLQLNTVHQRPERPSWALSVQEDICTKNYLQWHENEREQGESAWLQLLLADDARVNWWRETQEGDWVVHPRVRRDRMLLSLNSIWCLPGHQHTSYMSSNTAGFVRHTRTHMHKLNQANTMLGIARAHAHIFFSFIFTHDAHILAKWRKWGFENLAIFGMIFIVIF